MAVVCSARHRDATERVPYQAEVAGAPGQQQVDDNRTDVEEGQDIFDFGLLVDVEDFL
jgi:hypothetical protein